ncbi:sensor histidine kinase, partial [Ruminiclostridium cellobioparum]
GESLEKVRQALTSDISVDMRLEKKGNGIGLKNVNERIKLFYGNKYGIEITSIKGSFTKLTIRLPGVSQG